jgi:hypothetical protein
MTRYYAFVLLFLTMLFVCVLGSRQDYRDVGSGSTNTEPEPEPCDC